MRTATRIGAVDIGTVTTRLLVADVDEQGIEEVARSVDITHLGENLPSTGALSTGAMERVARVIREYVTRMRELGVTDTTCLATSASRDASNGAEFRQMLAAEGLEPEIITGEREAHLSFLGATLGREGTDLLVVDVGGGSTELVIGQALSSAIEIRRAASVDVGSRRITEMFLASDPPTDSEIRTARDYLREQLKSFFDDEPEVSHVISVAGTATTLAAIGMEMVEYDSDLIDGSALTDDSISAITRRLSSMTLAQREQVVGLHPQRAFVIVAGSLILSEVLGLAGHDSTTVSERDILYGMLLDAYRSAS